MSAYLDPPLPLQKSVETTKHLRSRDVPLASLLPVARSILESSKSGDPVVYFPQKEEWLLEWVVQRLREDDDAGASEARCNPEFWEFILHLLPVSTSAGAILKKHNILQLISRTFSEAAVLPTTCTVADFGGDTIMGEREGDSILEMVSSPASSTTERGSSVALATSPKLLKLLKSVSMVLLYIQQNWAAGSRAGNVATVLRGTPEIGAQILGSYLEASRVLAQCGLILEESWTRAVVNVWRSCIWGNPNSKKLSMLFSTSCLVPATRLISTPCSPSWLRTEMDQLIAEFIFSHEAIFPASNSGIKVVKPSPKDLKPLVAPLTAHKEGLPHIFKIGITSQTRRRKPNSDTVEAIFNSIISGALGVDSPSRDTADSDLEIIMEMLEVLVDTSTAISSETLAGLVDSISNISPGDHGSVRWNIVEVALKLDFDIFLGNGNEARASKLTDALTKNGQAEGIVFKVIELLMDGFARARDLEGFAKIWISELSKEESGIWENDKVAILFADRMEKGLLAEQIDRILRTACQEESWVVIDAVLRGVRREATEDKIRGSLLRITESVLKGEPGWRGWRALVRVLQIDKSLLRNVQPKALKVMKKFAANNTTRDQARETLFTSEVLMVSTDIDVHAEVVNVAVKAMKSVKEGWNGRVGDIHERNLGVALVTSFTCRWLGAFELVSPDVRTRFVDEYLNMATRNSFKDTNTNITGRTVWRRMLGSGMFYEYPALKDAVLAALINKLQPFLDMSVDVRISLENIQKGNVSIHQDETNRYEFLMESITGYPLETIKRVARERILDVLVLLDAGLEAGGVHERVRDGVKGLVERLWGLGNASSFLARDVGGFMDWVKGGGDQAGRKILRFILATKDQERSRVFLTTLAELAGKEFFLAGGIWIEAVKVCEVIVDEFWRAGEESTVKELRSRILQKLRGSIEAGGANSQLIGVWRRMWMLDPNSNDENEALGLAKGIIESAKYTLPKILTVTGHPEDGVGEATGVVAEALMLLCACSKTEEESTNTTALTVCMVDSLHAGSYKSQIMVAYKDMVANGLGPSIYLECLEMVVDGCFTLGGVVEPGYWEILKILVNAAKQPEGDELSKRMVFCLSTVLSKMAQNLPKARTDIEFLAISDCMYTILREKTWAVLQYNIDETLASITISSSPSGPDFPPTTIPTDEIFTRVYNIFRVIMTLHRRRVRGGRYHLVVAALQSLLYCIYKRKAPGERKKSDKVVHPPWLLLSASYCNGEPDRGATETIVITGKRVDGFNRLVTTFCEPSASSVRDRTRRKNDHNLVHSARDRERREVASCVGGLLGGILKGGLEGGFDGDITVSVYAIFEALGPEGVKTFARTIDRESRAMLRELWDEYNRVGGGSGGKL